MHNYQIYASDDTMNNYVQFICSQITDRFVNGNNCGASVADKNGHPMKGYYIPGRLVFTKVESRSAEAKLEILGFVKEFTFFMSRHQSPHELMEKVQKKINEVTLEIVNENNLDRNEIWDTFHPLTKKIKK